MIAGLIIAIVILIICSAMFSMCDIVYATVNQLRLKKLILNNPKMTSAKLALKFAENYNATLTTALFCNNLVNIAATSLSTVLAIQTLSTTSLGKEGATTLMSFILLLCLLIFGEILPKVIGRSFSYRLSLILAYPVIVCKTIFFPLVFISSKIGLLFSYPFIRGKKDDSISNEELQQMIDKIEDEGVIDEEQSELISNAIEFKDTEAHEIMTPRVKMKCINIDDDIKQIVKDDSLFNFTRIPVYKTTPDNIVGILSTKVLLRLLLAHKNVDIKSLLTAPSYVPGSMGISEILETMKESENHLVIVKDEYGGTDGILTMEDILEELVGEMWDEMDIVNESFQKIKRNAYIVDGSMNFDDLLSLLNINVALEEGYETLSGFILDKLERFAKVGDSLYFDKLYFKVVGVDEFTVTKVLVKILRKKR